MLKTSENNGTEEIGLVTPTPGPHFPLWYGNLSFTPREFTKPRDLCLESFMRIQYYIYTHQSLFYCPIAANTDVVVVIDAMTRLSFI